MIREARATAARERARAIMELSELLDVFNVKDLDALAAIAPVLEACSCVPFPRALALDAFGNPHPTAADAARLRPVAREARRDGGSRLGYVLSPQPALSVPRTLMALAVAVGAGLLS